MLGNPLSKLIGKDIKCDMVCYDNEGSMSELKKVALWMFASFA